MFLSQDCFVELRDALLTRRREELLFAVILLEFGDGIVRRPLSVGMFGRTHVAEKSVGKVGLRCRLSRIGCAAMPGALLSR